MKNKHQNLDSGKPMKIMRHLDALYGQTFVDIGLSHPYVIAEHRFPDLVFTFCYNNLHSSVKASH